MADPVATVDDLEDGEIGTDDEDVPSQPVDDRKEEIPVNVSDVQDEFKDTKAHNTKVGKKKKNKNKRKAEKLREKKNRKYSDSNNGDEDMSGRNDHYGKKGMNDNGDDEPYSQDEGDDKKNRKRRKRHDGKEGSSKKRKKQDLSDEMDESEMMCVGGASPVRRRSGSDREDERDSYASGGSHDSVEYHQRARPKRNRPVQRPRKNNNNNKNDRDRRRGAHPMQDPDGICLYFMQGKCHKGDDCMFSHDAQPPRRMELCKFYLMECCAKRDKCLYMHSDFPCKYYHTGLPCIYKDECKFAHGQPLTDNLKNILLKHIESAPKEILGDFPRLNREGAMKMIQTTQLKLMQQFSGDFSDQQEKSIPSLFDLNIQRPQQNDASMYNNDRQVKTSPKVRQSRWQNESSNFNLSPPMNAQASTNVLSIKNLSGVLSPSQITDLTKMGIDNLDQLGQLTVLQLSSIGISLKQISEIQLNTMSIQKLGLINDSAQPSSAFPPHSSAMDLDLRVPPAATAPNNVPAEFPGQDIDMRFLNTKAHEESTESQQNKDTIDIDEYTKDALKFASKESDNAQDMKKDQLDNTYQPQTKDVDHRVLHFVENNTAHAPLTDPSRKDTDTDIRFLQPEPIFKSPAKRNRRSTTDDDEDNLLIDEKWYSSDEEKGVKKKSPSESPQLMSPTQTPAPHVIEPSSVLSKLGDLSKIDISEEVTKLLNTMKNNLPENKSNDKVDEQDERKSRDPRDPRSRRSPESVGSPRPEANIVKSVSRKPKISIYECLDGEPTDGGRRTDVDLRDYNLPAFGDTDLRQGTSGDVDFRLGLPFKPLPNYTPASEIDGSINSHPPIPFKLVPIDIPRPDYTDIKNSTAKSQALVDPRLRKVFRLSVDEPTSDSEKPAKSAPAPRTDPRRKPKDNEAQEPKSLIDLQVVIQNSDWYKELSTTQKIFVNQQIATINSLIKQYQQDKSPGKKFDVSAIQSNSVFHSILTNLGVCLSENGEFSYLPKPKEGLLQTPNNYGNQLHNQNNPFGMNANVPGGLDNPNMNMMNMQSMNMGGMGSMNSMGMGNMQGYNAGYADPRSRPTPGLLGIAPNMPNNFNGNNFHGPNNYGNMPYNDPGQDFSNMENEQNYQRYQNRGGHRGRGNDRWNRGGRGGPRDRNRGNWRNDRN